MHRKFLCLFSFFILSNSLFCQLFPKRHFHTEDGLIQKQITTLFEDSRGALWIGTKGGVTRFDGHNMVSWSVQNGLAGNWIKAFSEDSAGGILVYTKDGVSRIYGKKVIGITSKNAPAPADEKTGQKVCSVIHPIAGKFWYDTQNNHTLWLRHDSTDVAINYPFGSITWLMLDKRMQIWVGTENGLVVFHNLLFLNFPGDTCYFVPDFKMTGQLPDTIQSVEYQLLRSRIGDSVNSVYTITRDLSGKVWYGNDYGLFYMDTNRVVRVRHGFLEQTVWSTALINDNRLLVGTSHGIGVLFLDSLEERGIIKLKWYDHRNGFEGGEVSINGIRTDHNQNIWIAGAQRMVKMDPDGIILDTIPVEAEINEVLVLDDPLEWKTDDPDSTVIYTLNHEQNQLRISYNSVNLKSPLRDFYQYRLVGHNKQWGPPTQEMFAIFNNLDPGEYRFEVRVRNKDDLWNSRPTPFKFVIIPAWYQTELFKVLFVILIVAIVILLTYHVTRQSQRLKLQKVKRNQELAELRLASIRSQLEPHFVFNVLNSIGYAIRANETDMAYDHLTKFSNLMRKWLKSAEEPMLTLKSELSLVRDYLDLEKFRFEERLNYSIEISELVPMDMMVPRMIIQIPVENAVKHGISNQVSGGKLLIKIDPEGDGIRILVQDNGVSREEAAKRTSAGNTKGLKLMEKLLDHIKLYHHYKVSLKVTDLYDSEQVACGTAVETIIK